MPTTMIKPDAAANIIGVSVFTLANWRSAGTGPPYVKGRVNGGRKGIYYDKAEIQKWLKSETIAVKP